VQNKLSKTPHQISKLFGDFANVVARAAGRPAAFVIAAAIIVVWAATGPVFQYSGTWQLIVAFLVLHGHLHAVLE
jgi:low affinity Fe/Cu permease